MKIHDIENMAANILRNAGIASCPVEVERIATQHRITIKRGTNPNFSGILIRKDGHALMGINNSEAHSRQRFTIAHELGHYFLHETKSAFVDYRDNKGATLTPREREANAFAAAILMPKNLLEKHVATRTRGGLLTQQDVEWLAKEYDVSEEAMGIRIMNLQLGKT